MFMAPAFRFSLHLFTIGYLCTLSLTLSATDLHVNPFTGSDSNPGTAIDAPFLTVQAAINSANPGDTVRLHPEGAIYRQSFVLRGKSDITIEGNNVTLDGSDPLPADGWEQLEPDLHRRKMRRGVFERHLLMFDGRMQRMNRTQAQDPPPFPEVADLKPGEFRFEILGEKDGWLYVRGSLENLEWSTRMNGLATSGHCENIRVRNLHARRFLNDGFNVHGEVTGLYLENITGYDCFDEGFSAHEACECEIRNGKFWGNENGIADVNETVTTYYNSEFYGNFNTDVLLAGRKHRLVDCVIRNTTSAAAVVAGPRGSTTEFELVLERVTVEGTAASRFRVNGGTLQVSDCHFGDVPLQSEGATVLNTR